MSVTEGALKVVGGFKAKCISSMTAAPGKPSLKHECGRRMSVLPWFN